MIVRRTRHWGLSTALVFCIGLFLAAASPVSAAGMSTAEIVSRTNAARADDGLPALSIDQRLTRAAQAKANDMIARDYFSHTDPDGARPWRWMSQADYPYLKAGENLAIDFANAAETVTAWLASTGHRKNILSPVFTNIGIGVATGDYNGRTKTIVVQFFGNTGSPTAKATTTVTTRPTSASPTTSSGSGLTEVNQPETVSATPTFVVESFADLPEPTKQPVTVPELRPDESGPSPEPSASATTGQLEAETPPDSKTEPMVHLAGFSALVLTAVFVGTQPMSRFLDDQQGNRQRQTIDGKDRQPMLAQELQQETNGQVAADQASHKTA